MSTAIARAVGDSMMRARALQQQRVAVAVVLQRYGAVESVERWARTVLASDEPRGYRLLFRIAEREA